MFKILILILLLLAVHRLVKKERKPLKLAALIYFTLLSIIFMAGSFYIRKEYQLSYNPVDGGFSKHMDWVAPFANIYVISLFILIAFKLFTLDNWNFRHMWSRVVTFGLLGLALTGAAYISIFAFILIFYGFAP
ncbi:hypothetical protein [Halobacillus litoralis]|uniref:hypothetical protein n=1 Tax=Halobacillus litoralis TaxID=45668 RepID=UPI002491C6B6|nr:hypothetical protein [Halobacillus litoralis]